MSTNIILVRHGQTEWNRLERFRGRYDVPLNSTGLKQADQVAKRILSQWKPVAIYSSPLSRAMQTADALAKCFHQSVISTDGLISIMVTGKA
jgi:probable phosphoglycerate mutase